MKQIPEAAASTSKFVAELPVAITLKALKIGLLQLNSTVGDFAANRQKLIAGYEKARALGAEFVLAPELFLCGYPPRDLLLRADFVDANLAALAETAKSVGAIPLCAGYVDKNSERPGRALRNSAAVLQNGKIIWRTHKSLLPTYDVFDEDRYFEPAKSTAPFEFNGRKLGITICEDIWNDEDFWPERLYRRDPIKELIGQGAEIILNIAASPWHDGKEKTRLAMLQRVARDERVPLAQVNLVGANDELIFDGHSVALDSRGEITALGKGFEEEIFVADLDEEQAPLTPSLSPSDGERVSEGRVRGTFKDLIIAGPAPAPLLRAETFYRYQIMLRTRAMSKLSQTLAKIVASLALPEDVTLTVDIDPVSLG